MMKPLVLLIVVLITTAGGLSVATLTRGEAAVDSL
jgi:hypothetical protein